MECIDNVTPTMLFVEDSENSEAVALGSIKARIKNFEFMKESGATSPQARSPALNFPNNESSKTLRWAGTSWEKGRSERRQMRRSERREAELRRVNEIAALKEKGKCVSLQKEEPNTVHVQQMANFPSEIKEKQAPRATPRVIPRAMPREISLVAPREKDRAPKPALRKMRRRRSEETWNNTEGNVRQAFHVQTFPFPQELPASQSTENSSNETIVANVWEDRADLSSEEEIEKEEGELTEMVRFVGREEEAYERKDAEDDSEAERKTSETEEQQTDNEENEEGKTETEADDQEETEQEFNDGSDEEDESEDETIAEQLKQHKQNSPVNEQPKLPRNKIAAYTNVRKTTTQQQQQQQQQHQQQQQQQQPNSKEQSNAVTRQENCNHDEKRGSKNSEFASKRLGSFREKNTKQHQQPGGNESGELRHRIQTGAAQPQNTSEIRKQPKNKKHRRHGSTSGSDLGKAWAEKLVKTPDILAEKSELVSAKAMKDEQGQAGFVKMKSFKSTKRSGNRNSLNSVTLADLEESCKKASSKSKPATKKEAKSNVLSGRRGRAASCADIEVFNECENEVVSPTAPMHLHPNNVLGFLPTAVQSTIEVESEGTSSPDLRNEDHHSKKVCVCAIHEEACKYYCQDCERLICSECAMRWGDCHEHYYLRVKDAWKKYREEMMKILQEARSNVVHIQEDIMENSKERDGFKLKVESTIKKINSFFDEHIQALEKRRANFLENVEEILKFREIGINQEIDCLQNSLVETNSTINVAGRVYGTSTMVEFLQVCKQLTNRLLELGHKPINLKITENVDIDFISEPNLFEEIENVGRLKKHCDSSAVAVYLQSAVPTGKTAEGGKKVDENDPLDSVAETSTENLSESLSAKDTNDSPQHVSRNDEVSTVGGNEKLTMNQGKNGINHDADEPVKIKPNPNPEMETKFNQFRSGIIPKELPIHRQDKEDLRSAPDAPQDTTADCPCGLADGVDPRNTLPCDAERFPDTEAPLKEKLTGQQNVQRHSSDDVSGIRSSKKEQIQRQLGKISRYRPPKSVAQFLDESERYFSSGEAEQRRRTQEYCKVRFNDRAYYSNPSDSSELEEMRGYDLEEQPVKHKARRHRTMPLIRPISERRELKSPWTLDVFRYHGKIHFSRNSLKATGKAFGWNAVVGSLGFSHGKHTWKVRVTKWTAVGVCYKDDHVDNPSWGAGDKWTWDSADMCYSPRLGVCESPVGEWIDGDIIALELDCDNSVLSVHNLRTSETDKLYGFKEPVYPYFYLSVFRSISLMEMDGIQVGQ